MRDSWEIMLIPMSATCVQVKSDGPMSQEEWNNPGELRHFSTVRKLDGQTFPIGISCTFCYSD